MYSLHGVKPARPERDRMPLARHSLDHPLHVSPTTLNIYACIISGYELTVLRQLLRCIIDRCTARDRLLALKIITPHKFAIDLRISLTFIVIQILSSVS